jgi:hypothetical protein
LISNSVVPPAQNVAELTAAVNQQSNISSQLVQTIQDLQCAVNGSNAMLFNNVAEQSIKQGRELKLMGDYLVGAEWKLWVF